MAKSGPSILFFAIAAVNLSACSYIKSWFPDKEKDYQYTTEIPPLVVPPALTDNPAFQQADGAANAADQAVASAASTQRSESPAAETPADATASVAPDRSEETSTAVDQAAGNQAKKTTQPKAELVAYSDGETRLRIGAEKAFAWRMVGKALSRQSIEVIDRNQEAGSYDVHYDPDEKPYEDGTLWDEAKFMFRGFKLNEERYQLKLIENDRQTDVAILDPGGQPLTTEASLALLKLIQSTINTDQTQ